MPKPPKVLIIEDDEQFSTILVKRLQMLHCEVTLSSNGLAGWELINSFYPDLIICDLMLPGLSGQEICQRVKSSPRFSHVYFMILTALDSVDDRVAGLEIGADDYISKPVNSKELMARIRAGLRISSLYSDLKASEQKYRALVENASDAIVLFNVQGKCLEANERACQILGYTNAELLTMQFADILPERDRAGATEKFNLMFHISHFTEEIQMQRKDGLIIPIESANTSINTSTGVICQCILRDITMRKENEQQLIQVEKLRALGGMVGGIAHDFNNLLAAILGYTELALRDSKDETMTRRLKVIEKAARDGAETVRLLQEFTRVRKDMRLETVDINKLIDQVLLLTRHRWKDAAQARGISIRIKTEYAELSTIEGNIGELREAFANIIFNAVDSLSTNGTIICRTSRQDHSIVVSVIDTGCGMSEEIRKRIFDPFFTTKGLNNSGLGLSVCYGIINRHGGEIQVESQEGKGSSFMVKLPISIPASLDVATTPQQPQPAKILVVDDELIVRSVIQEILEDEGYQVMIAESGEVALTLFSQSLFDLVITDLGMPGIAGWEVAARVKAINSAVPVILLTGWANQSDVMTAKQSGVDLILGKPISTKDLLTMVTQAISHNL